MYTIYNEDEGREQLVAEPDPSYTYTYADYLQWKFLERLELFKGRIYKMGAPNTLHQVEAGNLYGEKRNYFNAKNSQYFIHPYHILLPIQNNKKHNQIT